MKSSTDETFTLGELTVESDSKSLTMQMNRPDTGSVTGKNPLQSHTDLGKYDDYTVEHLKNLDVNRAGGKPRL